MEQRPLTAQQRSVLAFLVETPWATTHEVRKRLDMRGYYQAKACLSRLRERGLVEREIRFADGVQASHWKTTGEGVSELG